jgi:hypothetical protein
MTRKTSSLLVSLHRLSATRTGTWPTRTFFAPPVLDSVQQVAAELPNNPDVAGFATLVGQANRIASNQ